MDKIANRKIILIVLTGLFMTLIMGQAAVLRAQENKKPGQVNTSLYHIMLSHGQEAYNRGLHEKAGYYFLQAVKANQSGMAITWYECICGIKQEGTSTLKPAPDVVPPKKPARPLSVKETDPAKSGITKYVGEGC